MYLKINLKIKKKQPLWRRPVLLVQLLPKKKYLEKILVFFCPSIIKHHEEKCFRNVFFNFFQSIFHITTVSATTIHNNFHVKNQRASSPVERISQFTLRQLNRSKLALKLFQECLQPYTAVFSIININHSILHVTNME